MRFMKTSSPRFVKVEVRNYTVMHGYDAKNKEIEETVTQDVFVEKIVAIDRIQSITEKYILTTYAAGRLVYWEYKGGLKKIMAAFKRLGLL